jgi:hypothetical protein
LGADNSEGGKAAAGVGEAKKFEKGEEEKTKERQKQKGAS